MNYMSFLLVGLISLHAAISLSHQETNESFRVATVTSQQQASTCRRELENANKTLAQWGETLESMVNESKLSGSVRENVHKAANYVLDLIEDFGEQVSTRQPAQLARDLVNIRRQSNRMALEIYLHTFDMRWPQTSLRLSVTVERAQQACLDRQQIELLEAPQNPLQILASMPI